MRYHRYIASTKRIAAVVCGMLLGGVSACLSAGVKTGQGIFVAADGHDANPGTRKKAFATLERARDAVRALKKSGGGLPPGGVTVWLAGGTYELRKTFEMGPEDAGTAASPVVYRAVPGAEVRLSGGREIPASAFGPVTDTAVRARLDPAARDVVRVADLRALGITNFGKMMLRGFDRRLAPAGLELFFNDEPMTLAQWPNHGFAMTGRILDSGVPVTRPDQVAPRADPATLRGTFEFSNERIRRWAGVRDAWVFGYWCWDWADEYLPVQSVDVEKRQITLGRAHRYGLRDSKRFRVLNLLEELDRPGEWYLDREFGLLYFWPPSPLAGARIVVSILDQPLISLAETSHVLLRGLVIEAGRASGVRIVGGSDNTVAGCVIRNLGTVGVHIGDRAEYANTVYATRGGERNGVRSSELYHLGEEAIILSGGDRKTLTASGNFAINNGIHRYARIARTNRAGIALAGVGCRVAHNRIGHAPHQGVVFWGNDHLMEFNELHHLCEETADAGAFYIGRDWTMRGNVIRHNHVHHLGRFAAAREYGGTMAVYLDDWASGTTVTGNVVVNAYIGIMIGSGRDNHVEGNLWIASGKAAVHVDARGRGWAKKMLDGRDTTLFDRLKVVHHDQPPYSERYPKLARMLKDDPSLPQGTRIVNNICVGQWLDLLDGLKPRDVGLGDNLVLKSVAEAGFVAPDRGDFRLKDNSPVFQKLPGFKPIPFEKIGRFNDEYRADLPAEDAGNKQGQDKP
jgi:hypothetical protein